jgi:bifunctional DNA-binding transcriptional regulator/antitoxin component of YhaV-PrlF toxin-antitoxin module
MSKVTSNLQVAIPEAIADHAGFHPGDELEWVETAKGIYVRLQCRDGDLNASLEERLKEFDEATRRQQERQTPRPQVATSQDRGWTREDLYERGSVG